MLKRDVDVKREKLHSCQYYGEVCGEGSGGIGLVQQGEASDACVRQGCIYRGEACILIFQKYSYCSKLRNTN